MLVNELVRHGKVFSQISYPMRSHSINERPGTTFHLRKSMTNYWLKNLPAGGR
jgi:dipeptidyl-peptidase-4